MSSTPSSKGYLLYCGAYGKKYRLTENMVSQSEQLSYIFLDLKTERFICDGITENTAQMLYNWLKYHADDEEPQNQIGGSGLPVWDELFFRVQDFKTFKELFALSVSLKIPKLNDNIKTFKKLFIDKAQT